MSAGLWLWVSIGIAGESAELAYRESQRAELEQDYEGMRDACQRVAEAEPAGARSAACARKISALDRRRDADGTLSGWSALERVKRTFRSTSPEVRRSVVEEIWRSSGLSPVTRDEAALWLASDALSASSPERALLFSGPSVKTPAPDEPALASRLRQLHAEALAELGRAEEASAMQASVAVPASPQGARPTPVDRILASRRRQVIARAAAGLLFVFVISAAATVAWGLAAGKPRSRLVLSGLAPLGLVPLGIASLGAYLLAEGWERGAGRAVPWMGVGFVVVHLLVAVSLEIGPHSRLVRAGVRVQGAIATIAVTYLALWWTGTLGWVVSW